MRKLLGVSNLNIKFKILDGKKPKEQMCIRDRSTTSLTYISRWNSGWCPRERWAYSS